MIYIEILTTWKLMRCMVNDMTCYMIHELDIYDITKLILEYQILGGNDHYRNMMIRFNISQLCENRVSTRYMYTCS